MQPNIMNLIIKCQLNVNLLSWCQHLDLKTLHDVEHGLDLEKVSKLEKYQQMLWHEVALVLSPIVLHH
jgi:hypothetical protein